MDPPTIELARSLDEQAKSENMNGLQELFDNLNMETLALVSELTELKNEFT